MFQPLSNLSPEHLQTLPDKALIFLYTPTCGTCKLARRMLEVVVAMTPTISLFETDANFVPNELQALEIRSVPALLFVDQHQGEPLIKRVKYAFGGVDELLTDIQSFLRDV